MSDHVGRRIEIEVVHPQSGAGRWCLANVTVLSGDEGLPGATVTLSDVTEIALLREELRHQATYDPLTGCLNRACRGLSRPPDALAAAARLQDALARVVVTGRSVRVSASIGVSMTAPGTTLRALMNRADEAMYRSKRRRDRTPVFLSTAAEPMPASR